MRLLTLAVLVALAGCAAPRPTVWLKDGATQQDFDQARAQCEYEASAATQTTDTSFNTVFVQELDRAMRQRDLANLCMRAKGFREQQ